MGNKEIIEKLEHAEYELTALYWDMRDNHMRQNEIKRLDTILVKIDYLKRLIKQNS